MLRNFALLFLSVFLLMLGLGLQNTLIGVRAELEHFSTLAAGVVMASYFVGFILGSILCPLMIERVGHIRAFSALATLASAAAVLHALYQEPAFWSVLRVLTGFSIAGVYMVIESWVNGRSDNQNRGGLLAAYFFVNLGAVALGQQLIRLDDPASFQLFVHSSVLLSIAIIPVAMTRTDAPAVVRGPTLSLSALVAVSPYALFGAIAAGLANGAFWGMAPLYGVSIGLATGDVAVAMTVMILGGALFQYPLGKLSDRYDRRIVMGGANVVLAVAALAIGRLGLSTDTAPLVLSGAFGGLLLTQYSLVVAHANDFAAEDTFVQIASALLLVFGASAAVGPVVAGALMELLGPGALFTFIAAASALSAAYAAWRITRRDAPGAEETVEFQPVASHLSHSVLAPSRDALDSFEQSQEVQIAEAEAT